MKDQRVLASQGLFIDGEWIESEQTRTLKDRWTGEVTGRVAVATQEHSRRAVDAAAAAMARHYPVAQRAEVLGRVSALLAARAEALAALITSEIGKPISSSRVEVERGVETSRLASEEARRLPGHRVPLEAIAAGEDTLALTIPQPKGVVAAITPFNFPLNLVLHKIAPAIAAGCAVVLKPSDHAPRTAGFLTALFAEAGLRPGWLNLITGPADEVVSAWQSDPRIAVVTFTGSSCIGWSLKAQAPQKLHILELGSNTAMVVAADGDVERAAQAACTAAYANSGQACVSLQRIYVHRDLRSAFVDRLAALVAATPTGDPRDEKTVVGPLITDDACDRISLWVADAVARGAQLITGGTRQGSVLAPTVVFGAPADSPLICEEVFGPVVSVQEVESLDEAIAQVNASEYGLNTSLYTSDLAAAMAYAGRAEAGSVLINMPPSFRADHMPYGGVKSSGQGREGVRYAVAEMLDEKLVVLHP